MEEVYFDLESPQGSVYATAQHPEFSGTVNIESECKNTLIESILFEEPYKIVMEIEDDKRFRNNGFESDEQPPPNNFPHNFKDSIDDSQQFEDIKLEETLKEMISQINIESYQHVLLDPIMHINQIENFNPSYPSNLSEKIDSFSDDQPDEYELKDEMDENKEIYENYEEKEIIKDNILMKSAKLIKSGIFGISNYYVYEILSYLNNKRFLVHRRYKDFEWLYEILKENFKGLCIPPLPCKTFKWLQDPSEAELRRSKLESVLILLLNHSTLRKSQQF